jgi:hypothetical protein
MAHLSNAQLLTLKAAILAETDPAFVAFRNAGDKQSMGLWFSENTSPAFIVWKTAVTLNAIGDKINGVEWANLTSLNVARLQCVADYAPQGVNPSLADRRAFFHDIFSSAPTTQAQLGNSGALWKRTARRIEKLYATGAGSDASPATMVYEGTLDSSHVNDALEAV